jgi:hypothetical protein
MKKIYYFYFVFIFMLITLPCIAINAYPDMITIDHQSEKAQVAVFPFKYLFENKLQYNVKVTGFDGSKENKFIETAIIFLIDKYIEGNELKLSVRERELLFNFFILKVQNFAFKNRSTFNDFPFSESFKENLFSKPLILSKSQKDNDDSGDIINFKFIYRYIAEKRLIQIDCESKYNFSDIVELKTFYLPYNYTTFYADIEKLFIHEILSFVLKQNFYLVELNINHPAFIEIDGKIVTFFESESYPSTYLVPLSEGTHSIKIFAENANTIEQKLKIEKDTRLNFELQLKEANCQVTIITFPSSAQIKFENNYLGDSPVRINLYEGNRFFIISLKGYESKELPVSIGKEEKEKTLYVYLMPEKTTDFYINYSKQIIDKSYDYFWTGCIGLMTSILGYFIYDYSFQIAINPNYTYPYFGLILGSGMIVSGIVFFAIFEILSLDQLIKYYNYIRYYIN